MIKYTLFSILFLLSLTAKAEMFTPLSETEWKKQAALTGLFLVDRAQTRDIKNNPHLRETNHFLGSRPTDKEIDKHFAKAIALHTLAVYALPKEYRSPFQNTSIVVEFLVVGNNARIGLNMRW